MSQEIQNKYSDYIVYVDESGDHNMGKSIDTSYPIFVLAFCIFKKSEYSRTLVSSMKDFKFKFFGHDIINLHEREIRKSKGPFVFLTNPEKREPFFDGLNTLIKDTPFTVIATIILKNKLYCQQKNPYNMAMKFCLERLYKFLNRNNQKNSITHIVFERRGESEDRDLELEFRRIVAKDNSDNADYPFEMIFATKHTNSAGLQLADMIARPIGIHQLHPEHENRAYEIIRSKFHRGNFGDVLRFGLKIFP